MVRYVIVNDKNEIMSKINYHGWRKGGVVLGLYSTQQGATTLLNRYKRNFPDKPYYLKQVTIGVPTDLDVTVTMKMSKESAEMLKTTSAYGRFITDVR